MVASLVSEPYDLGHMGAGRNTRSGATSEDEGGDMADLSRIEVNLQTLFEAQNQRLVQTCNNNNLNIEQNAKNIAELNDLLLGLSMQVSKLVSTEGKDSEGVSHSRNTEKDTPTSETQNRYPTFSARMTKVEFPKFGGTDLRSWLYKCNQFFIIDNP